MPITIGKNIESLRAVRQLDRTGRDLSATFERLSSGQRINRAADDAAGLAIADSLRADSRVTSQAVRNVNDAVSYLNIADGAAEQLSGILFRIGELSEQAANGIYGTAQRGALDSEARALQSEYNRILDVTTYNGRSLLGTGAEELVVQMGYGVENLLKVTVGDGRLVGDGTFQAATSIASGVDPRSVISADINNDGKHDLVGGTGFGLNLFLGNGNGTFQAPSSLTVGIDQYSVTVADLNGDGKLDLVSADFGLGLWMFLGNGNGTFQASTSFATGNNPTSVISADLNGDGKLDLVSTDSGSDQLSLFLGNGNGTFQAPTSLATDNNPFSVISADLNGDGKIDLVSADSDGDNLSVFLGNGNGTFQGAVSYATGVDPYSITSADLNGDGKLDLISADAASNRLSVFLGNGNGTFQAPTSLATRTPFSVISADLNGDGRLDLVSADNFDRLNVYFGNGNGTFKAVISYYAGPEPFAVIADDVNGDGILDLLTTNYSPNTLSVLIGNGTNSPGLSPLSGTNLVSAAAARTTLDRVRTYIQEITTVRSTIGFNLARLQVSGSNLTTSRENFLAAESRIRDADIAAESSTLVRTQILQQTGSAVLAQANQQPQIVLSLLRTAGTPSR